MNTLMSETGRQAAIIASITVRGRPDAVASARAFVRRTLCAAGKGQTIDFEAATLLTSELVTNAIQHTLSGAAGGTVTIVVVDVADGVLIEVTDDGSPDTPAVQSDVVAPDGRGLYLVQQLAAQWGYLRGADGGAVWFYLTACSGALG